jgi:Fe-S oxidoreductase
MPTTTINNMDMQAKSKWSCIKCGVVIPYNPQYDMSNILCSNCATYQNADKLLGGYRSDNRKR